MNLFRSFFLTYLSVLGSSSADYTFTLHQNPVGSSGTTNLGLLDPSLPTFFITHGWLHGNTAPWMAQIKDAHLLTSSANVVLFDWTPYSLSSNYFNASKAVQSAGKKLGTMITALFRNQSINVATTQLIGFSLGAHVVGVAGETFKASTTATLEVIVGLDAPIWGFPADVGRLSNTDAKFVLAFHTSIEGRQDDYAHVDVFFNTNGFFWGLTQPDCPSNPGVDLPPGYQYVFCDHIRSVLYWIESVVDNRFLAVPCRRWGKVSGTLIGYGMSTSVRGRFCLETNGESPFGKGPNGVV